MSDLYRTPPEVEHLIKLPTRKKLITGKYRPWCKKDQIKMHRANITLLKHYNHPRSVATIKNLRDQIRRLQS